MMWMVACMAAAQTRWKSRNGVAEVDRIIKRILIIHQGALGDFICCLPALACLRLALPDAHMTFMGYPRVLEAVEHRFYADRVVSVDRADMALLYQEGDEYPIGLRDFFGTFQLIAVIGFDQSPFVQNLRKISKARLAVVPPFPSADKAVHMVDHLLSLPRSLGLPVHGGIPRLHLLERDRDAAGVFLGDHAITRDAFLIAIHPGSGSRAKTWPLERFLDLADDLVGEYQARILFIVGPAEEEIKHKVLRNRGATRPVILDGLPLPHLGAILERCRVFIGNDSGITHMAAAVGVPVVAIFGPSDPAIWAPRGTEIRLIRGTVSCSPCGRETMPRCQPGRCLLEISMDEVLHAVNRVIRNRGEKEHYGEAYHTQFVGGVRGHRRAVS